MLSFNRWSRELYIHPGDWIPWVLLILVIVTIILAIVVFTLNYIEKVIKR